MEINANIEDNSLIANNIKAYGVPPPIFLNKSEKDFKLINYLDLIDSRGSKFLPDAVAEFQSNPVLYIIDHSRLSETEAERKEKLLEAKKIIANRGDIAYIGVIKPGQLDVYPVDLEKELTGKIQVLQEDKGAVTFFQSLVSGKLDFKQKVEADYIYKRIFNLLEKSSDALISRGLSASEVISLIGRALFFRFLIDRSIIYDRDIKNICPGAKDLNECFADPDKSSATSAWLDKTFNGDLLTLPSGGNKEYFYKAGQKTEDAIFMHLTGIICGAKPEGGGYQLQLWKDLDFYHIPVGLLSQVYEKFSQRWNSDNSKTTSIHYTPRDIAGFLVDESFAALESPCKSKILDPSAGAGIFLVLAFKRIAAETWKKEGVRPDTGKIKEILYDQIFGFDINEEALKLAALSLYLTAIELDPNPTPPEKLKFPEPLKNKVLFCWRKQDDPPDGPVAGSLGDHLPPEHIGKYDLVIGNPPWKRLVGKEYSDIKALYTQTIRNIAGQRGLPDIAHSYENPDGNPDLPFVWKAMQWAKPDGIISFTLPARILLKQSGQGIKARNALFKAVTITGILNCSNLSDTDVWPDMNQPFCLFFSKNCLPKEDAHFQFVSPYFEDSLNSKRKMRIDYSAAEPVSVKLVMKETWLLKAFAVGSGLDIEVIRKLEKIATQKGTTIKNYWEKKKLATGVGYAVREKQEQHSASEMNGYPDLGSRKNFSFYLEAKKLLKTNRLAFFKRKTLSATRNICIYQPPLLLIPESMEEDHKSGKILLCFDKVLYNLSFFGYSTKGHPDAEELIRYLYLTLYSSLFSFFILLTSSKFGAERRTFLKMDVDSFPFIPLEKLDEKVRKKILPLSEKLAHEKIKPFDEIDDFICKEIYGLDDLDVQVIKDTVETGFPFKKSRELAQSPPTKEQKKEFISYLKEHLSPFFKVLNRELSIEEIDKGHSDISGSWQFLRLTALDKNFDKPAETDSLFLEKIMDIANKEGSSRIFIDENKGLILGLLNQYRYWTKTRARLCGNEILKNRMNSFDLNIGGL